MTRRRVDRTGQVFGRLTVLQREPDPPQDKHHPRWLCRCECGTAKMIRMSAVTSGTTQSCGCQKREYLSRVMRTHGHTVRGDRHPLYTTWAGMLQRCTNPNTPNYKYYGGRGIAVCSQWMESFEVFIRDVGDRPEGTTLDRIDVNGPYHKFNVRWATPKQQANNRRPAAAKSDGAAGAEQTAEQANREEK